jgi:hypothetical protein
MPRGQEGTNLQLLQLLECVFLDLVVHLELLLHVLEVGFQFLALGEGVGPLLALVLQLRLQVSQLLQQATPLLLRLLLLALEHTTQSSSRTAPQTCPAPAEAYILMANVTTGFKLYFL